MKLAIITWIQALESTGLSPTLTSGLVGQDREAQLEEILQTEARNAATVSILQQLPDKKLITPKIKSIRKNFQKGEENVVEN